MYTCQPAAQPQRGNAHMRHTSPKHSLPPTLTQNKIRFDHRYSHSAMMVSLPLARHVSMLPDQLPPTISTPSHNVAIPHGGLRFATSNAHFSPRFSHTRGRRGALPAIRCSNLAVQEAGIHQFTLTTRLPSIPSLIFSQPLSEFTKR